MKISQDRPEQSVTMSKRISPISNKKLKKPLAIAALILLVLLIPLGFSLSEALTAPGTLPLSIRAVEWVRSNGGGPIVSLAEKTWYSLNAPPKGGKPPAGLIPKTNKKITTKPQLESQGLIPYPIKTIATPPLPGEGQWRPVGKPIHGLYPIYIADFRSSKVYTSQVAAVAWMNTKTLTSVHLAAGYKEPGGTNWPLMSPIPASIRPNLLAAFNSGFRLSAARGGFYYNGTLGRGTPLTPGAASLVFYKNGTVNIGSWGSQVSLTPNVEAVRQNLSLLVNNSKLVSGLRSSNFQRWGATLGNQVRVWRSGVGITAQGDLVYAAGPGMSVHALANVLLHAGAVRAMELDINTDWVNYFYFNPAGSQPAGPSNGHRLLSTMLRPPLRYFQPTARDFVVLLKR